MATHEEWQVASDLIRAALRLADEAYKMGACHRHVLRPEQREALSQFETARQAYLSKRGQADAALAPPPAEAAIRRRLRETALCDHGAAICDLCDARALLDALTSTRQALAAVERERDEAREQLRPGSPTERPPRAGSGV